jgi:tetratricopeptide (TPR) repeat protein
MSRLTRPPLSKRAGPQISPQYQCAMREGQAIEAWKLSFQKASVLMNELKRARLMLPWLYAEWKRKYGERGFVQFQKNVSAVLFKGKKKSEAADQIFYESLTKAQKAVREHEEARRVLREIQIKCTKYRQTPVTTATILNTSLSKRAASSQCVAAKTTTRIALNNMKKAEFKARKASVEYERSRAKVDEVLYKMIDLQLKMEKEGRWEKVSVSGRLHPTLEAYVDKFRDLSRKAQTRAGQLQAEYMNTVDVYRKAEAEELILGCVQKSEQVPRASGPVTVSQRQCASIGVILRNARNSLARAKNEYEKAIKEEEKARENKYRDEEFSDLLRKTPNPYGTQARLEEQAAQSKARYHTLWALAKRNLSTAQNKYTNAVEVLNKAKDLVSKCQQFGREARIDSNRTPLSKRAAPCTSPKHKPGDKCWLDSETKIGAAYEVTILSSGCEGGRVTYEVRPSLKTMNVFEETLSTVPGASRK